jgi:hypothetical protein
VVSLFITLEVKVIIEIIKDGKKLCSFEVQDNSTGVAKLSFLNDCHIVSQQIDSPDNEFITKIEIKGDCRYE